MFTEGRPRRILWVPTPSHTGSPALSYYRSAYPLAPLFLTAALSCKDAPTTPSPVQPDRIAIGDTVSGTLAERGDTARFALRLERATEVVLFCGASGQRIDVRLVPRVPSFEPVYCFSAAADGRLRSWTTQARSLPAGDYELRATAASLDGGGATFTAHVYAVDRAPETSPTLIAVNDTVAAEALESPADVDVFSAPVVAGQTYIAYLQALAPNDRGASDAGMRLTLGGACGGSMLGGPVGPVRSQAASPGLERHASGRVVAKESGDCTLTVRYPGAEVYSGAYRLQLRIVDRRPERGGVLSVGDTLQESLDYVGDLDEFVLRGAPGSEYKLYAQAQGDTNAINLWVLRAGASYNPSEGDVLAFLTSSAESHQQLLDQSTETFALPASGELMIRVAGFMDSGGRDRGPYRLFVSPVDPAP